MGRTTSADNEYRLQGQGKHDRVARERERERMELDEREASV